MPRINREELLKRLQAVQPGLATREVVEQSSCFAFQNGEVITYNDEVACRFRSGLPKDFKGAVKAAPLINLLNKLPEEDIDLEMAEAELVIQGIKRKASIVMEKEIMLAVSIVEKPEEWHELHEEFAEAVDMVVQCASKDESRFNLLCVHLHPKYLEACDCLQAAKYKIKSGITQEALIRHDSLKHVTSLGMTEVSETEAWLHFRNATGLTLSVRRYLQDFPDLSGVYEVSGEPATIPKGLSDIVERAEIFSSENTDNDRITVEMRPGKIRIKGAGAHGKYSEVSDLQTYNGPPTSFLISPKLLTELSKQHNHCEIAKDRLKVDNGKFIYIAYLAKDGESSE